MQEHSQVRCVSNRRSSFRPSFSVDIATPDASPPGTPLGTPGPPSRFLRQVTLQDHMADSTPPAPRIRRFLRYRGPGSSSCTRCGCDPGPGLHDSRSKDIALSQVKRAGNPPCSRWLRSRSNWWTPRLLRPGYAAFSGKESREPVLASGGCGPGPNI